MVAILLYIGLRFQISFGVGAIVATIHDLLVTLAFLAFFQYDLSLNVIAAILTITGYSTNDTIVIFDRVRENARAMRRDGLNEVINRSINQTLGRTIITARHRAHERAGAVLVRRRSAARVRVHDGRGHHHRHVLDGFHRCGHRELLARQRPRTQVRRRQRPRSRSRPADPSIGKRARRSIDSRCVTLLLAALLGIVQGVTEFLPISSTAHLLLVAEAVGFDDPGGVFTVMIQLGSIFAVVWVYRAQTDRRC